jgi:acetyl esterase/lipase
VVLTHIYLLIKFYCNGKSICVEFSLKFNLLLEVGVILNGKKTSILIFFVVLSIIAVTGVFVEKSISNNKSVVNKQGKSTSEVIGVSPEFDKEFEELKELNYRKTAWSQYTNKNWLNALFKDAHKKIVIPTQYFAGINIQKYNIDGYALYKFAPQNNNSQKSIYFIHGGAFISQPNENHFIFIANLIKKFGYTVYLPIYPLATDLRYIQQYITQSFVFANNDFRKQYSSNINVIMGDSAGASLTLYLATSQKDITKNVNKFIVISPPATLNISNENVKSLQKNDYVLNYKYIKHIFYTLILQSFENKNDPRFNFLNADFSNVNNLTILTGTYDGLYHNIQLLHQKLIKENIPHTYIEFKKMPHDWIINFPEFAESKMATEKIYKILQS